LTLILFVSTDPGSIPPFLLIIPFVLLAISAYLGISLLLSMRDMPQKRRQSIAIIATGLPILLLVLQSIGQLTVRDVITTSAVFLLSYFYISRTVSSDG
jgi:hypothetical protein